MGTYRNALEREYSPSSCVDDLDALLAAYRSTSAHSRGVHPPTTHSYGPDECERLDVFAAGPGPAGPGSAAHLFVHGGYWQELSRDDSSFPADGFLSAGISYLTPDYGLAPRFTLDEIVAQVRAAVAWTHSHAGEVGIDPGRLVVSGSSAGAHLAAMAAIGGPSEPHRRPGVAGLVLLSGIYELTPLLDTYVNDALGLDADAADRNSPLRLVRDGPTGPFGHDRVPIPTIIAWGEHETGAFKSQSSRFAEAWRRAGNPVTRIEVAGRNHFDIVHDIADPATTLGAAVARLHRAVDRARRRR